MNKFWAWVIGSLMFGFGIFLSYFYFFSSVPAEKDMVLVKGILLRKGEYDDQKYFYIMGYSNRFTDSYLSRKEFNKIVFTIDSIFVHIRKIDTSRLNTGRSIKLWSLKLNNRVYYTAKQEIETQDHARKYYLPILILLCFILAPVLYRYQINKHRG
jgi:hypothetical protein